MRTASVLFAGVALALCLLVFQEDGPPVGDYMENPPAVIR